MSRATAAAPAASLAGCGAGTRHALPEGGGAGRGKRLIEYHGCGACHTIARIAEADATVGPPLTAVGNPSTIVGKLANTSENATHWIEEPQTYVPGNDMPDLGVGRAAARDIVAYPYGR